MKRKRLVTIAKLVFAAGLMAYVFSQINFSDHAVREQGGKEVEIKGTLQTSWREEVVTFTPANGQPEFRFRPGEKTDDGVTWHIHPGVFAQLKDLHWPWFLLGMLLHFIAASSSSLRWHWLVRANSLPFTRWEAFKLTWIRVFFNNVVPGLTGGDLVKAIYVVRHTGEKTRSIVSVIVDRIMGLASLALLAAIVVLFQLDQFRDLALGIYLVLFGTVVLAAVFFSKRLRKALRLDVLLGKLPLSDLLKKIDQAFHFYRNHIPGLLFWVVFSMANHTISVFALICIGQALGIPMPWYAYLVLIPVINIVCSVPIAPAGWGVGEALFGYFFKTYGAGYLPGVANAGAIMATRGVVLSIVFRLQMTVWSLLGGVFVALSKERIRVTEEEARAALGGTAPAPPPAVQPRRELEALGGERSAP